MEKKYWLAAALLIGAAVLSSCGKDQTENPPLPGTAVIEVTDASGNTVTNENGQPETVIVPVTVPETEPVTAEPDGTEIPHGTEVSPPVTSPETQAPQVSTKAEVKVSFLTEQTSWGHISGTKVQTLKNGKQGNTLVTAKPELGYKFVKWSDGVTTAARQGMTFTADTVVYAVFDYDTLEMPVLTINTATGGDVTSKTEYIGAVVNLFHTGNDESYALRDVAINIRGRGNNTWGYEKKSYKMKFSSGQNLLGVADGKGKKWVLLANMCDQSLLRNYVSLQLGGSFEHIIYEPHCASVEVYLNGEYRGVYLLAEEINIDEDRVAISEEAETGTDIGYLIEMSAYADGEVFYVGDKKFQIRSDLSTNSTVANQQKTYIQNYMNKCWAAMVKGDEKTCESLMDIDSFIDCYILEEILKNLDMGWDSFYLTKDAGGKLQLGPCWDFDLTLGNGNEGCEYYENLYCGILYEPNLSNPWFYRMMTNRWFRERVSARWKELYSDISTYPALVRTTAEANYNSFCRNFVKWQIFGTCQNRETEFITSLRSYKEHYEYLAQWMANRITWLDNCYRSEGFLSGQYTDKPYSPVSDEEVKGNDLAEQYFDGKTNYTPELFTYSTSIDGYDNEGIDNLFDGSVKTKYCAACQGELTIRFSAASPVQLIGYTLSTGNDTAEIPTRNPVSWVLYGSVNEHGGPWIKLDNVDNSDHTVLPEENYTAYGFAIDKPQALQYYKLVIKNSEIIRFSELRVFTD